MPSPASSHEAAVVGEQRVEGRRELGLERDVLDRHDHLDAVVEVARHQVGAAHVRRAAVARLEQEQAAVLEEAAEHAAHADALAQAGDAGPQRADAADDQVDARAGLRGRVELVDHLDVREVVHLDADPRLLARARRVGDRADLAREPLPQRERRDEQLAELAPAGRTR